jgi:hypothetical protein
MQFHNDLLRLTSAILLVAAMSDGEDGGGGGRDVREQDRFLPIANIARIMKKALPGNAKIAKDAKETTQECVSEFISFITSECVACGPGWGLPGWPHLAPAAQLSSAAQPAEANRIIYGLTCSLFLHGLFAQQHASTWCEQRPSKPQGCKVVSIRSLGAHCGCVPHDTRDTVG